MKLYSELHKSYTPLFSADVEAACKSVFRRSLLKKYGWLAGRLEDRDYLTGDAFTAADAYLYAVTRWAAHVDLDLSAVEPLQRFMRRTGERESVREALQAEGLPLGRSA